MISRSELFVRGAIHIEQEQRRLRQRHTFLSFSTSIFITLHAYLAVVSRRPFHIPPVGNLFSVCVLLLCVFARDTPDSAPRSFDISSLSVNDRPIMGWTMYIYPATDYALHTHRLVFHRPVWGWLIVYIGCPGGSHQLRYAYLLRVYSSRQGSAKVCSYIRVNGSGDDPENDSLHGSILGRLVGLDAINMID